MKGYLVVPIMIVASCLVFGSGTAGAVTLDIAQGPLFASIQPDPNLMITVDDSKSMEFQYMPDEISILTAITCGFKDKCAPLVGTDRFDPIAGQEVLNSAQTNRMYYDPRVTYLPWVNYQGESCPNIDYTRTPYPLDKDSKLMTTAALRMCQFNDPSDPSASNFPNDTMDLSKPRGDGKPHYSGLNGYAEYWIYTGTYPAKSPDKLIDNRNCSGQKGYEIDGVPISPDPCLTGSYIPVVISPDIAKYSVDTLADNIDYQTKYWNAFFATFGTNLKVASPKLSAQLTNDLANPNLKIYEDRTGRVDCRDNPDDPLTDPPNPKNSCTYEQEITNFANWYVYYRIRKNVVRAAMGQAIAQAFFTSNQPIRMGFGRANWTGLTDTGGGNQEDWGGTVKLGVRRLTVLDPVTQQVDVKTTDANRKQFFYDNLYNFTGDAGTTIERVMDDVGLYFKQPGDTGPWSNNPETADNSPQLACRQNYQVLVTDGYSFGGREGPRTVLPGGGNVDGAVGPDYTRSYDKYQVTNPVANPYQDQWSNTLADYASYYWMYDLRPDLDNLVPITSTEAAKDNAFWQHLVNYTVGLGVYGTLTPDSIDANGNFIRSEDSIALSNGTKQWPDPQANAKNNNAERIDDLWHAAVNSRGNFFNASDPKSLSTVLTKVIDSIVVGANGSASSAAANSTSLNNGSVIYQAKFRSSDWSGQLLAYTVQPDGSILDKNGNGSIDDGDALWDAGDVLSKKLKPDPNANSNILDRKVYTYNREGVACQGGPITKGTVLSFNNLSCGQQNLFNQPPYQGQDLVNYVLGDDKNEKRKDANGKVIGVFRSRTVILPDGQKEFRPLGDIVNSDPLFVGGENYEYSTLPDQEGSTYQKFLEAKNQVVNGNTPRPRMIYVGSNDGMLHAFEAGTWNNNDNGFDMGTGNEIFAFIPGSVVNQNLSGRATTDPLNHKFLVDGSPVAGDAYFADAWHTILLGTTGAGGYAKGKSPFGSVFALDVTDPLAFGDTAKGGQKVLWEFTKEDDRYLGVYQPDLGVPLAQPSLARMQNGAWAAIVGNGYNSKAGKAVLYLLDVSKKPGDDGFIMKKFVVCENNVTVCPGDNGLSTPIPVDVDGDKRVDYIYAGDLLGNLWKFDVICPANRDANSKQLKSNPKDDATCNPVTDWNVANGGVPLFTACDPNGNCALPSGRQPITGKPQVGSVGPAQANVLYGSKPPQLQPSVMVYFGTGKYVETTDVHVDVSSQAQTFYGLWDKNGGDATTDNTITGRDKLQKQEVLNIGNDTIQKAGLSFRVTSNNIPCYDGVDATDPTKLCDLELGWYMDLPATGERSVSHPILLNGNVVYVTLIPTTDQCIPGGSGWIMEQCAITGARSCSGPPFDIFGAANKPDGQFDSYDMVSYKGVETIPSGEQSVVGIIKHPATISGPGITGKYFSGSSGSMQTVIDPGEVLGRISWRQLR